MACRYYKPEINSPCNYVQYTFSLFYIYFNERYMHVRLHIRYIQPCICINTHVYHTNLLEQYIDTHRYIYISTYMHRELHTYIEKYICNSSDLFHFINFDIKSYLCVFRDVLRVLFETSSTHHKGYNWIYTIIFLVPHGGNVKKMYNTKKI